MYKDTYFEWDSEKESINIAKHNISFTEAQNAFTDQNRIIYKNKKHSKYEKRTYCIGMVKEKVIMVRFLMRGKRIRIFGVGAWRQAKKLYEQKNKI